MKRILLRIIVVILVILVADMIILESLKRFGANSDPLQMAKETNSPNTNFLFASNASLPGRIYMTFSRKDFLLSVRICNADALSNSIYMRLYNPIEYT